MRGLSPPDVRFGKHNKNAGERTRRFARATARAYCVLVEEKGTENTNKADTPREIYITKVEGRKDNLTSSTSAVGVWR